MTGSQNISLVMAQNQEKQEGMQVLASQVPVSIQFEANLETVIALINAVSQMPLAYSVSHPIMQGLEASARKAVAEYEARVASSKLAKAEEEAPVKEQKAPKMKVVKGEVKKSPGRPPKNNA